MILINNYILLNNVSKYKFILKMSMKNLLFFSLIVFSLSLEEKNSLKSTIVLYKGMSELEVPLQQDACKFENKEEDIHYFKPCPEGYQCGNYNKDIYKCIPHLILQKYGETCNYDSECIAGHCNLEEKKCEFSKNDKPFYNENLEIYRCGNGLYYYQERNKETNEIINQSCKEENELEFPEYCKYTKKGSPSIEITIESNKPFFVCGESKIAKEEDTQFEPETVYSKFSEIASLPLGSSTYSEYACQSGSVSPVENNDDIFTCDKVKEVKGTGSDKEKGIYVEYVYEIAGDVTIFDESYLLTNHITGELEAFGPDYEEAFTTYAQLIKKYKKYCKSGTFYYDFSPYDCGIKQIYDAYFYTTYYTYLYKNKEKGVEMVTQYLLNEDYDKVYVSSSIFKQKVTILGLISFLLLLF